MGASFSLGFAVGGVKTGNHAYADFMVANQHTKFITPYEAKVRSFELFFIMSFFEVE